MHRQATVRNAEDKKLSPERAILILLLSREPNVAVTLRDDCFTISSKLSSIELLM